MVGCVGWLVDVVKEGRKGRRRGLYVDGRCIPYGYERCFVYCVAVGRGCGEGRRSLGFGVVGNRVG